MLTGGDSHAILRLRGAGTIGVAEAGVAGGAGLPSEGSVVAGLRAIRPMAPMAATNPHAVMVIRVPILVAAMMATVGPIM